jgi:2'-5' RNA ligase
MGSALNETRQVYERLWHGAVPAFGRNDFEFDHHLLNKSQDLRRGLTLALRPCPKVQALIKAFLLELANAAPGQYFYRPEEFHVTVLAIIPGSESWQDKIHHLPAYQSIISGVLKKHSKFSIAFQGVTASRDAVMIQGFPGDDTLAQIRDELREALRQNKFDEQLDVRYKICTSHITAMRFCNANLEGTHLLTLLKANRTTDFGETCVANLELILGDWYASANTARTLQEYKLMAQGVYSKSNDD